MENLPDGFLYSGVSCGIKRSGKPDLGLVYSSFPSTVAGVFTSNSFRAAPVQEAAERLENRDRFRGLVVNSGVANAATGKAGREQNRSMIEAAAEQLAVDPREVLSASTGVIGEPLPLEKIRGGLPEAVDRLGESTEAFSEAILTTDSVTKVYSQPLEGLSGNMVGVAKGSGMIRPDMATMLAFLFLDVPVESGWLGEQLRRACRRSFNQITVDGDMSTNDTVLAFATELPGREKIGPKHPNRQAVVDGLQRTCRRLADAIVRDGEGATCVIEIRVEGAEKQTVAEAVADSIANSNLVKTAFHGGDPNWGRIFSSIGATSLDLDPGRVSIRINDQPVYRRGEVPPVSDELEQSMREGETHRVQVQLGNGSSSARRVTCDLSEEYVTINSEYHT